MRCMKPKKKKVRLPKAKRVRRARKALEKRPTPTVGTHIETLLDRIQRKGERAMRNTVAGMTAPLEAVAIGIARELEELDAALGDDEE